MSRAWILPTVALVALATLAACAEDKTAGTDAGPGRDANTGGEDGAPPLDDCPRVRVDVGDAGTLNVREAADPASTRLGSLPDGAVVTVVSRGEGVDVNGTTAWFEIDGLGQHGWISGAFAACTTDEIPALIPGSFYLPLPCGMSARISQGNDGGTSHQGRALYAFDFAIPLETPLVAMADGTVTFTFAETGPGDPCYTGGPSSCFAYANYVVLKHADGSGSIYKHLNRVDVTVGQAVTSGQIVGLSGSTGYSTGPHAHVMRQEDCGAATSCQSIAVAFADVPGDGVPDTGETVTSGNCPAP